MHVAIVTTALLTLLRVSLAVPAPADPVVFPIILDPIPEDFDANWTEFHHLPTRDLQARSPNCGYPPGARVPYNNVMACANYLKSLGTRNCVVQSASAGGTTMCQSGPAFIRGRAINANSASSYCGDVANTVAGIASSCNFNGVVAGDDFVYGNGYFGVSATA